MPERDVSETVSKVAGVTIFFWITKILSTTLGETAGDFISMTLSLGYTWGSPLLVVLYVSTTYTARRRNNQNTAR